MTVTFKIEYRTAWGESLALVLLDKKYPMAWGEGAVWSVSVKDCPAAALKDYTYVVMRDGLIVRTEWSHHSARAYWHPELFNLDSSTGAPPDFFSTDGQNRGFPTYNWEEMANDEKRLVHKTDQLFSSQCRKSLSRERVTTVDTSPGLGCISTA